MQIPIEPAGAARFGGYVEGAIRWLFAWGVGLSVEVHAAYVVATEGGASFLQLYPAITIYGEYW